MRLKSNFNTWPSSSGVFEAAKNNNLTAKFKVNSPPEP